MYEWEKNMKVVVLSGSPRKNGNTQIMMKHVLEYVNQKGVEVKFINLAEDGFESFKGAANEVSYNDKTLQAAKDITDADVWLVGIPVYNSMFSAALKNIFEFINYKETEGKTAGLAIVAGGTISFGDVQTLFTQLMSYLSNKKAGSKGFDPSTYSLGSYCAIHAAPRAQQKNNLK